MTRYERKVPRPKDVGAERASKMSDTALEYSRGLAQCRTKLLVDNHWDGKGGGINGNIEDNLLTIS